MGSLQAIMRQGVVQRESERKGAALALSAIDRYRTTMPRHDLSHQVEADAEPTDLLGIDIPCTKELCKEVRLCRLRDADPTIGDRYSCLLIRVGDLHPDRPTPWAILDRVTQQIMQDLVKPLLISHDQPRSLGQLHDQ